MAQANLHGREAQLAHGCQLTVLTDWLRVSGGRMPDVLSELGKVMLDHRFDKYDLLAVRGFHNQVAAPRFQDLLVGDVQTAIGLHGAETLMVRLQDNLRLTEPLGEFHGRVDKMLGRRSVVKVDSEPAVRLPVVVTCMDWRIHGGGDFARLVGERLGYSDFYLMTVPGVAKDLGEPGDRLDQVVEQIGGYQEYLAGGKIRVHLVSHTDCGKYGGSCAFGSALHERFDLQWDLLRASGQLAQRVPGIKVGCHVLKIEEDRPSSLA